MELRHLRYFVAVAEEENVTRAAARLHVSQPPLTRQIQDLEEELGLVLFERTGKAIHLTEVGRVFLDEARAVLQRVDDAVKATQAFAARHVGELHLGFAPSPTVEILPALLRSLRSHLPGVRVTLHDQSSPEMLLGLREARLHAAIMMQPPKQAARDLIFEPLRSYPVVVAVAPSHPFTSRRSVTAQQVLAQPLVVYARNLYPDYHDWLSRTFATRAQRLRFVEECDSGPSLFSAVASGRGAAVVPSIVAQAAGSRLRQVPISPAPPAAVVGIAYRPDRLTPPLRTLLDLARQNAT